MKAWDNYDGESINDCPREFSRIQKFVLLAYDIGGRDLEKFKVRTKAFKDVASVGLFVQIFFVLHKTRPF